MPDIYWYISKAKLDLLKDASPSLFARVTAKIDFKIPFVSGSISSAESSSMIHDLGRVIKTLRSQLNIKDYSALDNDDTPAMISFEGPAVRHVAGEEFWLAMEHNETALLLAGSAGYAVGYPSKTPAQFSPSIDPVAAFLAAFEPNPKRGSQVFALSYAWREIMADTLSSGGAVPRVEGLAVFARTLATDKKEMRAVDRGRINRLIVGSPLYVRQI
jgi:hypothetical protein